MATLLRYIGCILAAGGLSACAALQAPPVIQSRAALWQRYGHQPLDALIMAWGAPSAETRLTDGSRLLTYRRTTTYDAESPQEIISDCEAVFLAKAPRYRISNVAMRGDPYECELLAEGKPGEVRHIYIPPPYPYPYPYPYRYPFYRHP
ncbi:MAG: hypothetical protein KGI29_02115 [Pseudomonadota bacterium]|nr:hypothetical protein [Pseudomonadota bacterium]MDE3037710.1 hypothetical protein [Pseudomonadota bacterium]